MISVGIVICYCLCGLTCYLEHNNVIMSTVYYCSRIYTCPMYTKTIIYFEWLVAIVLMLNTAYHFGCYFRRSFYLDPVILSPAQKKLMGISDSGTIFIVENI